MSFRSLFSRLAFWSATVCALLSLWFPAPLGARLATLALGAAALSLIVWRGWKPPPPEDLVPESTLLDETNLREAAEQIASRCARAPSLDDALRGVGAILAHELGARHVRLARISCELDGLRIEPLAPTLLPEARLPGLGLSATAKRALRERGVVSDASVGHALVVRDDERPTALLEFESLALAADPAALTRLLEDTAVELGAAARRVRQGNSKPAAATLPLGGELAGLSVDAPGFLSSISANRQVSLFVVDPRGLRLVAMSACAVRDFRTWRGRVLGKTLTEAVGEAIGQAAQAAIGDAIDSGQTVEHEVHWSTPRGQRGANVSWCALRNDDGSLRWLIAMARDLAWGPHAAAERRVMPRHGLLHADAQAEPAAALPRPAAHTARRRGSR